MNVYIPFRLQTFLEEMVRVIRLLYLRDKIFFSFLNACINDLLALKVPQVNSLASWIVYSSKSA